MKSVKIKYQNTGYFSKTVTDYLSQNETIKPFYGHFPNLAGFKKQLSVRAQSRTTINRKTLVNTLNAQYKKLTVSEKSRKNIQSLLQENTFTITTGHQLNLFTGPLYFLYKISSAINLCEQLKNEFPQQNFVPIYWMATEDHDFEEIQYFNFKNQKITWERTSNGAVGRLSTQGLESVFNEILKLFGENQYANRLKDLFKKSYLEHDNLADATRFLANELFKNRGLVILDADDKHLKNEFAPFVKDELLNQTSFYEVSKTVAEFGKNYKVQVKPRELNLFYLTDEFRERIILDNDKYVINNTSIVFSKNEILEELKLYPERFSPNVIMRPLYQEVILPNLCYIGGGGELAYWFELKSYFEKVNVEFPILLLRNSALIVNQNQDKKLTKLAISTEDLFLKQNELINKKVTELSNLELDFSAQKTVLKNQFLDLLAVAKKTDKSFIGAVKAQEKKQLNGLATLEKRLLKAEKRKLNDVVSRMTKIQNELFPKQSLQERYTNFSELYLEHGDTLITALASQLKPLDLEFTILTL
jgi:bacillithiol biosynthesis cysteine-adding enzyme BshC